MPLLHGVFMRIFNIGTLLMGESGIGQHKITLSLINNGHALIADDAPQFYPGNEKIIGVCPELLQDFLHVRGLGVLNIRAMFGDSAIAASQALQLIVTLTKQQNLQDSQHMTGITAQQKVLDQQIPEMMIPIDAGRNLPVLYVETCVRKFMLEQQGYNASEEFTQRHKVGL